MAHWPEEQANRQRFEKATPTIRPVAIAARTNAHALVLVLVLPGGARVEGLELTDIAELARSLA